MKILKFNNLSVFDSEIEHFISTREGGVSKDSFESLNLGLHVGDDPKKVLKNRQNLAKQLNIPLEGFVFAQQTHGKHVFIASKKHAGRGAVEYKTAIGDTDAFITAEKGVCVVILVADCVPIILFDPKQGVIAVVHAGWKGTVQKILKKTVQRMKEEFDCEGKDILGGIGPSIGACHFEVQSEVFNQFEKCFGIENEALIVQGRRLAIDLQKLNEGQLIAENIPKENIETMKVCTSCRRDEFFSARKKDKGRFAIGIVLKKGDFAN